MPSSSDLRRWFIGEPTLTRHGYRVKDLAEQFNAKDKPEWASILGNSDYKSEFQEYLRNLTLSHNHHGRAHTEVQAHHALAVVQTPAPLPAAAVAVAVVPGAANPVAPESHFAAQDLKS